MTRPRWCKKQKLNKDTKESSRARQRFWTLQRVEHLIRGRQVMSGQRSRAEWKRPLTTRRVRQPHFPFGSRQFDHIRGLHCGTKFTKAIVSEHYYIQRLDSKAFHLVKTCIAYQKSCFPINGTNLTRTKRTFWIWWTHLSKCEIPIPLGRFSGSSFSRNGSEACTKEWLVP